MRKNLKSEELDELLTGSTVAILATHMQNGHSLLSPVWHEFRDGGFTVMTFAKDVKTRHLDHNPMASVVVADSQPPYRGIEIRGEAKVSHPTDDLDILRRLAIRYLGEARGNDYADGMKEIDFAMIRLEPGTLRTWDYSDEEMLT